MSSCTRWIDEQVITCKLWGERRKRACLEWGDHWTRKCIEWGEETQRVCDRWETRWEQACADWDDRCCDWWPCSWGCQLITWVCVAWTWVSSTVCTGYVWVVTQVCKAFVWLVEKVCIVSVWLVVAACLVWSWGMKVFCWIWDWIRCSYRALERAAVYLFRRERRRIKYVFVLMLENRSLDHMLGFSDIRGTDAVTGAPTRLDDLFANPHDNLDPGTGVRIPASPPADFALSSAAGDPGHEFMNTVIQLGGPNASYPYSSAQQYPPIDNSGFVADYRNTGSAFPGKAMSCYSPKQLPVLNALAREFAICDHWFSSMPGPTWPNRFFVHAASSGGLDDSPGSFDTAVSTLVDGFRFDNGTIFDKLEDKCRGWLVFEGDETPQVFSLSGMTYNALHGKFRDFEDFRDSVNDPAFPAAYTFIEPDYGNIMPWTPGDFTCGTSQHPLDDVARGEWLIKEVYEAIRNSPLWESSLLVITWDEHGGFYDHVAPPATVHPGDSISDPDNNHHNFDFTRLGVRVPAVIVSPFTPRGLIDHTTYDHSSLIKTVGQIFGFGSLTNRDQQANSFLHLMSLSTLRDAPTTLPNPADSGLTCETVFPWDSISRADKMTERGPRTQEERAMTENPRPAREGVNPTLRGFVQVALRRHLSIAALSEHDAIVARVRSIRTDEDAKAYIAQVKELSKAHKALYPQRKPWRNVRGNR